MRTCRTLLRMIVFAIFTSPLVSSTHPAVHQNHHRGRSHVALFIFGDSLNDAGTNDYINTTSNFRANFAPYGETFFHFPTGRFSDGRLIVDFIAEHAKLPLVPPYLELHKHDELRGGANFASGGAGALADTYKGYVVSLEMQLKQLEQLEERLRVELGDEEGRKVISEAVYVISIGSNDYSNPVLHDPTLLQPYSLEGYVGMVIGNITAVLKGMHKIGARKFGMIGIGPIGCVPAARLAAGRNGSCSSTATKLAKLHNAALLSTLTKLEAQLQGFKYSYLDFFTSGTQRINHPSKYGFKDGKTACCGSGLYRGIGSCGGHRSVKAFELCENPNEYMFFDSGHPSEAANEQFARLFWSGSPNVARPYNLETLFKMSP